MHRRSLSGFLLPFILLVLFLTFGLGAWAEPPSLKPNAHDCAAQAEGFINARLGIWQQRLNLADWKISIVMTPARDLKPKTLGNIHWDTNKKTAVIRVLDAADYQLSCREAQADMELTMVHELVHLDLSSLPRSLASRHEEELAVNRITDALVRLEARPPTPATADAAGTRACAPVAFALAQ